MLALSAQLVASTTSAQPSAFVLLVADDPKHAGTALRISSKATRLLARAQGLEAGDPVSALDPKIDAERRADIKDGIESVDRGVLAFEDLELESAGAELDLAVNILLSHVDHLSATERDTLDMAMFALGTTTLFEGQGDLADKIFVAVASLSPGFEPDPDRYPSNVVSRFAEIRATVDSRPTGSMQITSNPPGAGVFIDGVFRGSTPLRVDALADGQHAVILNRLCYRSFGTLAPVTAGRESRIDADLEPTEAAPTCDSITVALAHDAPGAIALGRKLGFAKFAILAMKTTMASQTASGLWIDVEAGRVLGEIQTVSIVSEPEVAATTVLGAIAQAVDEKSPPGEAPITDIPPSQAPPPDAPAGDPVVLVEPEEPSGDPGIAQQWWFWAIVGGVVVVAAAGSAAIAATTSGSDGPPNSGFILGF